MNYAGNGTVISVPPSPNGQAAAKGACACQCSCPAPKGTQQVSERPPLAQKREGETSNGKVDFSKMTPAQKIAYHKARWDQILG